ncbi:MAG: ribonuclease J [Beijerinckiaceae bacterium]
MSETPELVFVPLGGLGEIGMNAALYGIGSGKKRQWLMVDVGVAFGGADLPGVDLILPDITFIEKERKNLAGIVITHAHEDHFGALAALWPRLGVPVYMTPFASDLLEVRRLGEPGAPKIPVRIVKQGDRLKIGAFDVEFIPVAHSVPESCALAIRTEAGTVIHTGDWKTDPTPVVGLPTDEKRLAEIGDEGVLAMIGDSTNIFREGVSPSEADVGKALRELIAASPARVAVTTFASNVARMRSVAEAALACGREVICVGRAMDRVVGVARDQGMLDGLPAFRGVDAYGYLPPDKVVALLTGSQGESRAALARIARDEHPDVTLGSGDRVIFSSRTIPGNEKEVGAIINALYRQGIDVITDRTHLVHVSGHPRRAEMEKLYSWVRPRVAVPAHGEAAHLTEHATFARAQGVPHVVRAFNGDMVMLSGDTPGVVDQVQVGRIYRDGDILLAATERTVPERRKLAFAGVVSVAIAVDVNGSLMSDAEVMTAGLPPRTADGVDFDKMILDTVEELLENLPKAKRRDPDAIRVTLERAIRNTVSAKWDKKPVCHVLVTLV